MKCGISKFVVFCFVLVLFARGFTPIKETHKECKLSKREHRQRTHPPHNIKIGNT